MSMNVGDVIYANNMAGDSMPYTVNGVEKTWNDYHFNTFGGNIHMSVYVSWLTHAIRLQLFEYVNGAWQQVSGAYSMDLWGEKSTDYNSGPGSYYFKVETSGNDTSMSWNFSTLRTAACTRIQGHLIRHIDIANVGYKPPGSDKIYAYQINQGMCCTY